MTLNPVSHWRFGWFPSGLIGGGGRGGPGRLIGIVAGIALAVGAVVVVSVRSHHSEPASQVAKMKAGSLLPGGLMGTPAQDALLKTDSQEKAKKAEAAHVSYTPPMPSSNPFNGRMPAEPGLGGESEFQPIAPAAAVAPPREPQVVPAPPPRYTPPAAAQGASGARIVKVAAGDGDFAPGPPPAQGANQREKAIGDLLNSWNARPPETTVVLAPAVVQQGSGDPPALSKMVAGPAAERVLVPAGRGIYAHTVLAVNSDTNGPIVLEADTGPIAGDRMIGTFSQSGVDRLIVKVQTVEHRGQSLDANGIVVAPGSMEEAVATSIDQHYLERFVLPAAAAFVQGLGQAAVMSNSTVQMSPFGLTQSFGPLSLQQQAFAGGAAAAAAVGNAMTASIPKGPTVHLAANVSVGVMFLSNLSVK